MWFAKSVINSSIFVWANNIDGIIYVLVYVDDFVIARNHPSSHQSFSSQICFTFQSHDLGHLLYFLELGAKVYP